MNEELYIEGEKVDLFGKENIEITSAVADISDITKNLTDYSKNFKVTASDTNNKIFKHYYNALIDNTFDARLRKNANIYLNGVLFKKGKIQLNKVKVEDGKPSSYDLNFFGNLLNLSDKTKEDKLSVLNLSAFDHPYNGATIKTGLETGLFGGDIVYCLFYKKQLFYNSDPSNTTNTETLSNIAWQGGANNTGVDFNFLKPSIKNIRIIEAIETKYDINFSRDFFGREEFLKSYLWVNNDSENTAGGGSVQPFFDGGDLQFIDPTTNYFNITINRFNPDPPNSYQSFFIDFTVTPEVGYESVPYTIKYFRNGEIIDNIFYQTGGTKTRNNTFTDSEEYEAYYIIESELEFSFTTNLRQRGYGSSGLFTVLLIDINSTSSVQTIGSSLRVNEELPDITVIDYLKGLFKACKLVVYPTSENDLYVNTLNDYYKQGDLFDITKYVDRSSYEVKRGDLLNEINFTFEEPKCILNVEFEKQNNIYYGNEESKVRVDQSDHNSELIDGKKKDFEVPFEVIKYDRLTDQNDEVQTNVMYAPVVDEELKPVNPAPHLHYVTNQSLGNKTIGFIDELDNKTEVTKINIPLHCDRINEPNFSLLFSQEFNEWDGAIMPNTLYSNYHAEYITNIFNIKRRDYKFKAFLPFNITTNLSLDDVLKIDNSYFRINKYTINLTTGQTQLDLISSFGKLNVFATERTTIIVNFESQIESVFVLNGTNISVTLNDTGDGIGWVSASKVGQNVYFDFSENTSFVSRTATATIENLNNPPESILITLIQNGSQILTSDSNFITVDSNFITADNG